MTSDSSARNQRLAVNPTDLWVSKVRSLEPGCVVSQMAEKLRESLDAGAAPGMPVTEREGVVAVEFAVAAVDGVSVPCSVEPIPSWHWEDFLLPFQQTP